MEKIERVAVKVSKEVAAKIEEALRATGDEALVEIADKYQAKLVEKVVGPKEVNVYNYEKKAFEKILAERVDVTELKVGDIVRFGNVMSRHTVTNIEEDIVTLERESRKNRGEIEVTRVIEKRFTRLIEEKAVETAVEESAKDRKNRIRREKRAAKKAAAEKAA